MTVFAVTESDVEAVGKETTAVNVFIWFLCAIAFNIYNIEQYMAPEGHYETITTVDNATWYRQYAVDTVDWTPYMAEKNCLP